MSLDKLILALLVSITLFVLLWEFWQRRRANRPTCSRCGGPLKAMEPGRRYCPTCQRYYRRVTS